MQKHKFATGDLVSVAPQRDNPNIGPGIYKIIRPLPVTNLGCQYRARHDKDGYERVLDESQLEAVRPPLGQANDPG